MKLSKLFSISIFLVSTSVFAQQPIFIEGEAQGTTYHITYFDSKNRDFYYEIDSLLYAFEESVSTYRPNSIISRINRN
jgi:thiamine biosynthesis lipoprotein